MEPEEYLASVLSSQNLKEDSTELKELRAHKKEAEEILKGAFAESNPTIRYGGSYIKGTLIKQNYDLDLICYFEPDDTKPGESLKEIYDNVKEVLSEHYYVEPKTSALRLRSKDTAQTNFHIDIVPGRFVDKESGDAFLHQSNTDKDRLKTNLDKHIEYIKGSGHTDAIRLVKLWREKNGLSIKTFPLELLVIKLLEGTRKDASLTKKLAKFWSEVKDNSGNIHVEDPANPSGNDLSVIHNTTVLASLSIAATQALNAIEISGWESVFGQAEVMGDQEKLNAIRQAASKIQDFPRPHLAQ